jgi:hypothetical protein
VIFSTFTVTFGWYPKPWPNFHVTNVTNVADGTDFLGLSDNLWWRLQIWWIIIIFTIETTTVGRCVNTRLWQKSFDIFRISWKLLEQVKSVAALVLENVWESWERRIKSVLEVAWKGKILAARARWKLLEKVQRVASRACRKLLEKVKSVEERKKCRQKKVTWLADPPHPTPPHTWTCTPQDYNVNITVAGNTWKSAFQPVGANHLTMMWVHRPIFRHTRYVSA